MSSDVLLSVYSLIDETTIVLAVSRSLDRSSTELKKSKTMEVVLLADRNAGCERHKCSCLWPISTNYQLHKQVVSLCQAWKRVRHTLRTCDGQNIVARRASA